MHYITVLVYYYTYSILYYIVLLLFVIITKVLIMSIFIHTILLVYSIPLHHTGQNSHVTAVDDAQTLLNEANYQVLLGS